MQLGVSKYATERNTSPHRIPPGRSSLVLGQSCANRTQRLAAGPRKARSRVTRTAAVKGSLSCPENLEVTMGKILPRNYSNPFVSNSHKDATFDLT